MVVTEHAGIDMGENKISMAEKPLDINRGSYNNISVMKHKKINNEIYTVSRIVRKSSAI